MARKRRHQGVGSFEGFSCKNCGISFQELVDQVPRKDVWAEVKAHADGKCKEAV